MTEIALWGGVECTVNRVQNTYFDQLARTGHDRRPSDLDRFAALGIRTLRTPVLWERTAPEGSTDFSWSDVWLGRMEDLGMTPIIGLVHHGSGPAYTSLVDDAFADRLAIYAQDVARRYPHVEAWTPINEPLTTARFSGLYGHWFPHRRDSRTCFRALVNQCRAIVLAMRAIRSVIPEAKLVQTEDLGRVFSSRALAEQAAYENERRWLSLDLLFGRVDPEHRLWKELVAHGIHERELGFFLDGDPPPDIVGINYYVTSDRYLDERLDRFPPRTHGGNGRQRYADIEAVRALPRGIVGHEEVLLDAWTRFRTPVALTEVHLGCTREEQLRWLLEAWRGAGRARARGADVRAVTAWSLLGGHDWNSLLVRSTGYYECGAFDARTDPPRPTALARALRALVEEGRFEHPAIDAPGWWRRPERLEVGLEEADAPSGIRLAPERSATTRSILVIGRGGGLSRAVADACALRALAHQLVPDDPRAVRAVMDCLRPWAVVNAAGTSTSALAATCAERGIPLFTFSNEHARDDVDGVAYLAVVNAALDRLIDGMSPGEPDV
jgi:dTDP-4-dehydrorhamnose reductase